jgi:predicted DNA-binding transcriptional regulator YafY
MRIAYKEEQVLTFAYKNHRGEMAERRVIPGMFYFGSTEWHPEEQWMLRAFDLDKERMRDFAFADIMPIDANNRINDLESRIEGMEGDLQEYGLRELD